MRLKFLQTTLLLGLSFFAYYANAQSGVNIYQATLMESNQKTPEISTQEMQNILDEKSALVVDPRSSKDYAIDHIPGAINIPDKNTGSAESDSVIAQIGRMVKNNKAAPIVLYCTDRFAVKINIWRISFLPPGTRMSGVTSLEYPSGEFWLA